MHVPGHIHAFPCVSVLLTNLEREKKNQCPIYPNAQPMQSFILTHVYLNPTTSNPSNALPQSPQ